MPQFRQEAAWPVSNWLMVTQSPPMLLTVPSPSLFSIPPYLLAPFSLPSIISFPQTMVTHRPWISGATIFCVAGVVLFYLTIYCNRSKPRQRRPRRILQTKQKVLRNNSVRRRNTGAREGDEVTGSGSESASYSETETQKDKQKVICLSVRSLLFYFFDHCRQVSISDSKYPYILILLTEFD